MDVLQKSPALNWVTLLYFVKKMCELVERPTSETLHTEKRMLC